MKAVCFTNRGKFEVKDIPEPTIASTDEVKIRIRYASLCGDDVRVLRGDLGDFFENQIMGDEMSGEIVELGENARKAGYKIGDCVSGITRQPCGKCIYCASGRTHACPNIEPRGAICEYIVLKYDQICRLPSTVSLKDGVLIPTIAVCIGCVEQANIRLGNTAAIFGAGGTGLVALQLALRSGASEVTVVEPVESKRQLALALGASHAIDPTTENVFAESYRITGNRGFDSVIETSGAVNGFAEAERVVASCGTLVTISIYHADFKYKLNMLDFLWRQLTIRAVRNPSSKHLIDSANIIKQLDLSNLSATVFPISELNNAYKAFTSGLYPKIIIEMG